MNTELQELLQYSTSVGIPSDYVKRDDRTGNFFTIIDATLNALETYSTMIDVYNDVSGYEFSGLRGSSDDISEDVTMILYKIIVEANTYVLSPEKILHLTVIFNNFITQANDVYKEVKESKVGIYKDSDDFLAYYEEWRLRYDSTLKRERTKLGQLAAVGVHLNRYPDVKYTNFEPSEITLEATITLDSKPTTIDIGETIFRRFKVDYDIPFIKYVGISGESVFKFFSSKNMNMSILDIKDIVIKDDKRRGIDSSINVIYLNIRKRKQFFTCKILLKQSLFRAKIIGTEISQNDLFEMVTSRLQGLNIYDPYELKVKGSLTIIPPEIVNPDGTTSMKDYSIDPISFMYMVQNNPLMAYFLSIDEHSETLATRDKIKILIAGGSQKIVAFVDQDTVTGGEKFIIHRLGASSADESRVDLSEYRSRTPDDYVVVKLGIDNASNTESVLKFAETFAKLIEYYVDNSAPIEGAYETLLAPFKEAEIQRQAPAKKTSKRAGSLLSVLQEHDPDMYVHDYAVACSTRTQPKVVDESYPGQKMKMEPVGLPEYYITCDENRNGLNYLYLKLNPKTQDYVPCCKKRDDGLGLISSYNEVRNSLTAPTKGGTRGTRGCIITNKVLAYEGCGILSPQLTDIISSALAKTGVLISGEDQIIRFGVLRSPASIIHCIIYALNAYGSRPDPNYRGHETYVRKIRREGLNPLVVAQEMYDYSQESIIHTYTSPREYLDPLLYYHWIEELYNVSIYLFDHDGTMIIPPHDHYYTRRYVNRDCIMLLINPGSTSDNLEYEQCDLIRAGGSFVFGPQVNDILYEMFIDSSRVLEAGVVSTPSITYWRVKSPIVYLDNCNTIEAQFIDNSGKVRAIVTAGYLYFVPPLQPYNVRAITPSDYIARDYSEVVSMFGPATGKKTLVDGVTDPRSGSYAVFGAIYDSIMILVRGDGSALPEMEYMMPINIANVPTMTERIAKMKLDVSIIEQILKFVFLLSIVREGRIDRHFAREFVANYFAYDNVQQNTHTYYDFSNINTTFPIIELNAETDSVPYIMNYYAQMIPTLVSSGKFIMINRKFGLAMAYYLHRYAIMHERLPISLPSKIYTGVGITSSRTERNIIVIVGESAMERWKIDYIRKSEISVKDTVLEPDVTEPYILKSDSSEIYIIQNIEKLDAKSALYLAYIWFRDRINLGYDVQAPDDFVIPSYVIYNVNKFRKLTVNERNIVGPSRYLEIISYGRNRYAAMLPILKA